MLVLLLLRPRLMQWDKRAAASADVYLANSSVVRDRIHERYGREAEVVPPAHSIDPAAPRTAIPKLEPGFFICVSRLLPYKNVDAVVLSHAHIDHSGNLPSLVRRGFDGPIYCTSATRDLAARMLLDSSKIQESDANILEVTKPYAKELLQRGYEAKKMFKNLGKDARYVGKYARAMPKFLHDILRQVAKGKQRVEIWHDGFRQFDVKFEKSLNRLTVGLVISASILAAALVLNSAQKVLVFSINLLGLQDVSLTALLGIVGYIIATVLGVWLIFSIYRSGKL